MNKLWEWFGLSRASFLVLPRVLMHEMPEEWQEKMSELLHEYDETFDTSSLSIKSVSVVARGCDGKIVKLPDSIINYRHPDNEAIENFKVGVK